MKKVLFFAIFLIIYGLGFSQQIWFEGFESATFPPAGWNIIDIAGAKTWELYTDYPHSGTKAARHDFDYGLHATALVTSPISLPNYGTPTLEFWSYMQIIGYEYAGILVSTTNNTNINAFTEIKVLSGDEVTLGSWKNIKVPLSAYIGQTVYIAFLYSGTYANRWTVDDISITHFEGFVDMQATGITPKTGEYATFSHDEKITVQLKNNGGGEASGFSLKLFLDNNLKATETFTGTIPSLGTGEYTFNATLDLSAAGQHKIQVEAVLTGDQVPANNTATSMVTNLGCVAITNFPYKEGFENNGENLPNCWTQEIVEGNINWRIRPSSAFIPNMEPDNAFEGDYRAIFYYGGARNVAKLITPIFDLTALSNPVLKFHHVQQRWEYFGLDAQDSLKVYYKTSVKGEWKLLEKYTKEVFGWTERVIPLPEPSNEYFIAFEAHHCDARSVQIDKVIIEDYFQTDIAVKEISPSGTLLDLSNNQQITATIKNNGRAPVSGFTLSLYVNENLIATEEFPDVIPAIGEVTYTFKTTVDMSISGRYEIKVVSDFAGDQFAENNTLALIVRNLVCNALTFPHDEDFEEYVFPAHCWTTYGPGWERRTYGGHSGISRATVAWWDTDEGWYISPRFSLPANGNFMLEFWSEMYEPRFFTYSGVWISTTNNNPASFTEIYSFGGGDIPEDEWIKIEIPLNSYAGQNIYIAFKFRDNGGDTGHMWSIDDFKIYNLNTNKDAELLAITAPTTGKNLTDEEEVIVKIKNNGTNNISNFPLTLELDDALLATETFTGYIPSMQVATYRFVQNVDLSEPDRSYTIKVTVDLENDEDAANNFKTIIVTHIPDTVNVSVYEINPLRAWSQNDMLYIDGLNVGDTWRVYSVIGALVYQGVARNETVSFKPKTHGFYMIQSGKRAVKALY